MITLISHPAAAIRVEASTLLTPEAIQLIGRTVWGVTGALYRVLDYPETLQQIQGARFLYLYEGNRLAGFRLLVPKAVRWGRQSYNANYHSLFIIDKKDQGKGYGKRLADATLEQAQSHIRDRGLLYAFTEVGNVRSFHIKDAQGYVPVGLFFTTAFSRFFPKMHPGVRRLKPEERAAMVKRLYARYADHGLADFDYSLQTPHYYVLCEGVEVIAGVQAERQTWTIDALEGIGGRIALKVLPHLPLLRDLFNPRHFEFLRFGNLYFKDGCARAAHQLLESVLAQHQLKTAMGFMDKRSPVDKAFRQAGSLGPLNALTETPVNVNAYFKGIPNADIRALQALPLSISATDV